MQRGPGQSRYWKEERHTYLMSVAGTDSLVYLVSSSAGVYSSADFPVPAPTVMTIRPAPQANQGQTYYGMQRMVNPPDQFYREQQRQYI
ncbi:hypothetical protein Tco_0938657 [Tanacetum coccineum]|uniref:Uncharacterized protein n=1 Tax=Tanacetum coccineum TaxID=301880 RepID=A0ABQ5DKC5_9ASTR